MEIYNISYIKVDLVAVLKCRPLADSAIMAPPGGCFAHIHKQHPSLQIVILGERVIASLAFFKRNTLIYMCTIIVSLCKTVYLVTMLNQQVIYNLFDVA